MENLKEKNRPEETEKNDFENPFDRNLDLYRMNQEIMLQKLVNYRSGNTIAQKLNKFFSIFF